MVQANQGGASKRRRSDLRLRAEMITFKEGSQLARQPVVHNGQCRASGAWVMHLKACSNGGGAGIIK